MEYDLFKLTQESINRIENRFNRYIDRIERELESAYSDIDRKISTGFRDSDRIYHYYESHEQSLKIDRELRETLDSFKDWYKSMKEHIKELRVDLKELIEYLENSYLPSYNRCEGVLLGISLGCPHVFYSTYDDTEYKDNRFKLPDGLIFVIKNYELKSYFKDSYARLTGYGDNEEIEYEELDYTIDGKFDPRDIDLDFKYYNKYGELINRNNRR